MAPRTHARLITKQSTRGQSKVRWVLTKCRGLPSSVARFRKGHLRLPHSMDIALGGIRAFPVERPGQWCAPRRFGEGTPQIVKATLHECFHRCERFSRQEPSQVRRASATAQPSRHNMGGPLIKLQYGTQAGGELGLGTRGRGSGIDSAQPSCYTPDGDRTRIGQRKSWRLALRRHH